MCASKSKGIVTQTEEPLLIGRYADGLLAKHVAAASGKSLVESIKQIILS